MEMDQQALPKISRRALIAQAGLIVLLTLVTYLPALRNGFIWDDDDHLTANAAMTAPDGLRLIWSSLPVSRYYPLTLTTFWAQRRFWGLDPLPYHAVNLLLHAASAALLFLLLRQLAVRGAWVAAAIWAVHPVNVESVAWITELKNTQSGLLYFLSLLFWLRFKARSKSAWYWLALLCFTGALLSKPSTVVLPAVLLLIAWWREEQWRGADMLRFIPFVVVAAGMSALTVVEQRGHILRSGAPDWSASIAQRLALAGWDVWFYAGKLLCPLDLSFVYPRWQIDKAGLIGFLPLLGAVGVACTLWVCRRRTVAQASAFGLGYFLIALLPVLGFVDVFYFRYSFVADHFQYLASIGLIALAVAAGASVLRRRALRAVLAGAVIAVLGIMSWQRCGAFHDDETVWRDTLAKNPDCWMACNNLGLVLERAGNVQDAYGWYAQALQIKPDYADAHINLANLLSRAGRLQEAAGHYEEALRIEPGNAKAPYDFGLALAQAGKLPEAVARYEEALRLQPLYADAHNNLANALSQMGNVPAAIDHYEEALRIDPDFAEAHNNLAVLLASRGQIRQAIAQYHEALRADPDYAKACNNLARLLAMENGLTAYDRAEAVPLAEQACRLTDNRQAICLDTLAAAYAGVGRFPDAVRAAQQAIDLANATGQKALAADIKARLNDYQSRSPEH